MNSDIRELKNQMAQCGRQKNSELSREFRKGSRSKTLERIKRLRGDSSLKTPKRIQNYRQEWQDNPCRSRWLRPVPGKSTRAQCILCKTDLTADISVINKHSEKALKNQNYNLHLQQSETHQSKQC